MKLSSVFIGIGIALLVFLFLIPLFIGSQIASRQSNGSDTGIFKSTDGGMTWSLAVRSSELTSSLPRNILSFVFHPEDARTILAGTKGGGLWVSKNSGASWARMSDARGGLLDTADIYDISISRQNPDLMYLAVFQNHYGRVFRSTDGGISFDEVYSVSIRQFGVFGVLADPGNVNRVFVATGQGGFLISDDKGESWRVQKWFPDGIVRLVAHASTSREFIAVGSRGDLYRTEDAGESWLRLTEGYNVFRNANQIQDVALDPSRPSTIYTGSGFGVIRSQDGGRVWRAVPVIIPPAALPVRAVAVDGRNSSKIFAATANHIYRSDDFGENWQILQLPTGVPIRMLKISPEDPNVIFAIASR